MILLADAGEVAATRVVGPKKRRSARIRILGRTLSLDLESGHARYRGRRVDITRLILLRRQLRLLLGAAKPARQAGWPRREIVVEALAVRGRIYEALG